MLSPDDLLGLLSPKALGTDVENFGMETATSSLNRVVVDLRLGPTFLIIGMTRSPMAESSSIATASSSSAPVPGCVSRSFEEACVEVLEESLDSELDFFSMGGGRVVVVVSIFLFSFGTESFFAATVEGLVIVGVTDLPSKPTSLDRGPDSTEVEGGMEGALGGWDSGRAAL